MLRPSIHILLGTYNGSRYIREQIASIQAQTWPEWRLLIRDDASTDSTISIVEELAALDRRVQLVPNDGSNLGCVGNFSQLTDVALAQNARYVMFADQDDVWYPNKIRMTLDCMLDAETKRGAETPILVHTDLKVVDQTGVTVHPSFMRLQRIYHERKNPLKVLLVQNFVTGCTTMVNRSLLTLGAPIPATVLMHDWWLAACAGACGALEFVPHPTMSYRRHGANAVTVRGFSRTINPLLTNWRSLWLTGKRDHVRTVGQAEALLARLLERDSGDEATIRLIRQFVDLHRATVTSTSRLRRAFGARLRSQTCVRTLTLYVRFLDWSVDQISLSADSHPQS